MIDSTYFSLWKKMDEMKDITSFYKIWDLDQIDSMFYREREEWLGGQRSEQIVRAQMVGQLALGGQKMKDL